MSWLRSTDFNIAVSAIATAVITTLAYLWLGFVGVALVGLLVGFVAIRVDLGRETTLGFMALEQMSRSERDAHDAETAAMMRVVAIAKVLGLVLAIGGAVGFFTLQLPH